VIAIISDHLSFLLSELNRFTINSINHNHHDDASRAASRDDGVISNRNYWLRSAGSYTGAPVTIVGTLGPRTAAGAGNPNIGIRPSFS